MGHISGDVAFACIKVCVVWHPDGYRIEGVYAGGVRTRVRALAAIGAHGRNNVAEVIDTVLARKRHVTIADQTVQRTRHAAHRNHSRRWRVRRRRHIHGAGDLIIKDVRGRDVPLARGVLAQSGTCRQCAQPHRAQRRYN